mmetsp:Transcript_10886/g.50280  ORF Transcript_10886/g.50280 Transcript_10886/m.50280 type:complete len:291 (+) Transcript_10886:2090-2962(+)
MFASVRVSAQRQIEFDRYTPVPLRFACGLIPLGLIRVICIVVEHACLVVVVAVVVVAGDESPREHLLRNLGRGKVRARRPLLLRRDGRRVDDASEEPSYRIRRARGSILRPFDSVAGVFVVDGASRSLGDELDGNPHRATRVAESRDETLAVVTRRPHGLGRCAGYRHGRLVRSEAARGAHATSGFTQRRPQRRSLSSGLLFFLFFLLVQASRRLVALVPAPRVPLLSTLVVLQEQERGSAKDVSLQVLGIPAQLFHRALAPLESDVGGDRQGRVEFASKRDRRADDDLP